MKFCMGQEDSLDCMLYVYMCVGVIRQMAPITFCSEYLFFLGGGGCFKRTLTNTVPKVEFAIMCNIGAAIENLIRVVDDEQIEAV